MPKEGVTFIELLLVLVIIGFLTTMSVPYLRKSFDNFETETLAKEIFYLSNLLQASAVAEEKTYCLAIDLAKKELRAFSLEDGIQHPLHGRLGKTYTLTKETQLAITPAQITQACFYPDGSSEQAVISLSNKHHKNFSIVFKGILNELKEQ